MVIQIDQIISTSIETERCVLRPITLADLDDLHRLFTDPLVRRYLWDDVIIERERVRQLIRENLALFAETGAGLWSVSERLSATLIGFTGFWHFHEPPRLQLLYGLDPGHWGRGIATEASRAMLKYGFDQLALNRIEASTDGPNTASVRVMKRLGLSFSQRVELEGKETIFYAITREAFLNR
jgi:ribosomal-protein-alanine N-acetyltransferase